MLESNRGVREGEECIEECIDVLLWGIERDVDIPLPRAWFGYWDKGKVNNKMDAEYAARLFMIHNSAD
ncbi:hypothetical protein NX722_00310 [Endozoicomonas gorgoniicola]|uniref:Uncharacterized protein n=1 Tax=Endozoicomonas gorgoniicola TaxID=1234144 RepID=A0ABT3MP18_9GAMM|nr:hypothetical protein [Endozoicomonas gorgoniicola]MCW7551124.1 hypothetical protein [Endozoicomonas gorgoniicola]